MEAHMGYASRIRAALAGTTIALCLASTVLVSACAVKTASFDYPAMRLTDPATAEPQPAQ
jgi:hypothetical protein